MKIDDVIKIISDNENAKGIVRKGIFEEFMCVDSTTACTFFYNSYKFNSLNGLDSKEKDIFKEFCVQYICFMLSKYPLRGMSATVKNCDFNTAKYEIFKKEKNAYLYQKIFEKIAINAYFDLGIKDFIADSNLKTILINRSFYDSHKKNFIDQMEQILFLLNSVNKADADDVLSKWKEWNSSVSWDKYYNYDWISTFYEELKENGTIYKNLNNYIVDACDKETKETKTIHGGCAAGGYPVSYTDTRTYTYYGKAVGRWLKDVADKKGYFSGKEPAYTGTSAPSSGCVVKGTKILMADMTFKNIEDIVYNDVIFNCQKGNSYTSKELIVNPYVKEVYSVNSDEPFMSLEHPIMTNRGWCSLDPELSMKINPCFTVNKLQVGDKFVKINLNNNGLEFLNVTIEKINIKSNNAVCYDLDFYDGNKSYYANGYPCLCNYPHITTESILSAINKMNSQERESVIEFFNNNKYIIGKLIGEISLEMLLMSINGR